MYWRTGGHRELVEGGKEDKAEAAVISDNSAGILSMD